MIDEFQDVVVNDETKEIVVLKGRQVGATSLFIKHLEKGYTNLVYFSKYFIQVNNLKTQVIKWLETQFKGPTTIDIRQNYVGIKGETNYNIFFFSGDSGISGPSYNIVRNLSSKLDGFDVHDIELLFFDEYSNEVIDLRHHWPRAKQIWCFTPNPKERERSYYVAPSLLNPSLSINQLKEFKKMYDKENFRNEVMAGAFIPMDRLVPDKQDHNKKEDLPEFELCPEFPKINKTPLSYNMSMEHKNHCSTFNFLTLFENDLIEKTRERREWHRYLKDNM